MHIPAMCIRRRDVDHLSHLTDAKVSSPLEISNYYVGFIYDYFVCQDCLLTQNSLCKGT